MITFQSPSPDILLRLNIDISRKVVSSQIPEKVVSQFPERNLPSITKVSAPLDGRVEPDEGFVATEYKKEIQVTKRKIPVAKNDIYDIP